MTYIFQADHNIATNKVVLKMVVEDHNGNRAACHSMRMDKMIPGEIVPAFTILNQEEANQLMDTLWNAGARPSGWRSGEPNPGFDVVGAALRAHLEDMRKLVFKSAGIAAATPSSTPITGGHL